jgi:superfamily I DNA and/or RNA helicase
MFKAYIESIKTLIKKYVPESERSNTVKTNQIDKCIQELAIAFYNERLNTTDNLEDKKAIVIGEFLERFENDAETLIDKYSLTTAATCQQSMPLYSRNEESYDMVIVDEAARATPLDLFIPMSMGRKIILVGDHKQLPHMLEPDVLKLILDDPQYKDLPQLDISLFERLFSMFDSGIRPKAIPLDTQYRMHPDICSFVSEAFYDNRLKSGITAEDRVVPQEIFDGKALAYINVTKNQGVEHGRASKARSAEVNRIAEDIKKLLDKCPDITIGVITFYSAQRDELTNKIKEVLNDNQYSRVEIGTVDAFQGKEFDYVFLSCVRSNNHKEEKHSVGFLVKPNRICVALSRAKHQLAVYADAETINKVECFKLLYKKCRENKEGYYHEY